MNVVTVSEFFAKHKDYGYRYVGPNLVQFHFRFSVDNYKRLENVLKRHYAEDISICFTKVNKTKSWVHIAGRYTKNSQFAYEFDTARRLLSMKKGA
jgi:hypothetical protein